MIKYARAKYFINGITKILLVAKVFVSVHFMRYFPTTPTGELVKLPSSQTLFSIPAMIASC